MTAAPAGRRLAVLGSPVSHSRSPALHDAAYAVLGLDWSFEALEVGAGELAGFWAGLDASWRGFAVTMPLKREVMALVTELDAVARRADAVNTVLFAGDAVRGFNTDVHGVARALDELGVREPRSVAILGAGATAASAIVASAQVGATSLRIVARSAPRAAAAARLAEELGLRVTVSSFTEPVPRGQDVVISTLPGGVSFTEADLAALAPAPLRERTPLLDIAYGSRSDLVEAWRGVGGRALTGLAMLLHQAVQQVRVFVSGDPLVPLDGEAEVVEAMRAALASH